MIISATIYVISLRGKLKPQLYSNPEKKCDVG